MIFETRLNSENFMKILRHAAYSTRKKKSKHLIVSIRTWLLIMQSRVDFNASVSLDYVCHLQRASWGWRLLHLGHLCRCFEWTELTPPSESAKNQTAAIKQAQWIKGRLWDVFCTAAFPVSFEHWWCYHADSLEKRGLQNLYVSPDMLSL